MQGITITKYTFNDPDLSWAERVLIEKIHLYDNDEKGCFASNKTLADFVGVKENSLANMLSSLTARNKISRISFDGKNRGYRSRLHPAKHISEPSQKSETSEEASQNNEGYPSQFYEASPEPSQKNDGNLHKKVIQEPSQKSEHIKKENKDEYLEKKELLKEKDISNEISKKKKPQIAFETFPIPRSDVETDLWSLFLESRARMKIPLTEGAYKKIVGQLEKIPLFDINDRLVEAVDRKWRGLIFPEDLQNGKLSPIEAKELINGRHQKPFTNAGDRNAERIQNSNGFIESLIAEAERIEQQNAFSGGDCEDHQENDFIVQPPALIGDGLGRTG
jgi:hypothetical protein